MICCDFKYSSLILATDTEIRFFTADGNLCQRTYLKYHAFNTKAFQGWFPNNQDPSSTTKVGHWQLECCKATELDAFPSRMLMISYSSHSFMMNFSSDLKFLTRKG